MAFGIDIPTVDDAPLLADLHLRAMDSNALTRAQFPNTEAMDFFRAWLTENTKEHIMKPKKGILVARDEETGQIASFVKWLDNPTGEQTNITVEGSLIERGFPPFCGRDILEEYANITAAARRNIMGPRPCYRKCVFPFRD